ncbi:MAG: transketolase C-terminal domain-containing protein [Acidimicrobiales bacterium]
MLREIEGSRAIAETVALCRPQVVCAYPISPQTHIIEGIGVLVKEGRLSPCEFVNVESEFAAMSVSIGASATGARAYTATASQGLLFMTEAVYNASGLGLPIVMTVANRAIGAPINIWNDHSDAMALRDSGWIQLFAESNQHAVDLHVQAFRLAEELSVPVMVCMDGFILTHAVERVDIPDQDQVDRFLPSFTPHEELDWARPASIGSMVGPEAFTEVRYLAHARQLEALERIPELSAEYGKVVGRARGGLFDAYRCDDAETIVVALGSVVGTIKDVVDAMRADGARIGVISLTTFRPFPLDELADVLAGASRVIVVEKAFAIGAKGFLGADVGAVVAHEGTPVHTVIAGLGGRAIGESSLRRVFEDASRGELNGMCFLDLDRGVVDRELERMSLDPRLPPSAHRVLADVRRQASRTV